RSAGLQTPGDNRVFAVLREICDVFLVGAGTARSEGYGPAVPSDARQARRVAMGYPAIPRTALISGSLDIDPSSPLIAEAPESARTIVLTHGASDPSRRAALAVAGADVLVVGSTSVDLPAVRDHLVELGLRRILCEGGPSLLSSMVDAQVADELCLSLTPWLVGPGPGRIAAGLEWGSDPRGAQLTHLLEDDGALFARYRLPR
ncbi:MAG: pyrimidine reductase, riboflavin biosynthesis, partial [Jatrophihabitantaceae bacterium]|nr:pyrimidine reductase, riboflavin biosynthesis [Jatrophihabitantaceae bacterium]